MGIVANWSMGNANIDKRKVVGIGSSKVEVFSVKLELRSLGSNKTPRSLRGCRANEAGRRNNQQV